MHFIGLVLDLGFADIKKITCFLFVVFRIDWAHMPFIINQYAASCPGTTLRKARYLFTSAVY